MISAFDDFSSDEYLLVVVSCFLSSKVLIILIGVVIGAVIATTGFLIYENANKQDNQNQKNH